MVARLKLKGIDGRAPPGVKLCSSASGLEKSAASREKRPFSSRGNTFKLPGIPGKQLVPPTLGNQCVAPR